MITHKLNKEMKRKITNKVVCTCKSSKEIHNVKRFEWNGTSLISVHHFETRIELWLNVGNVMHRIRSHESKCVAKWKDVHKELLLLFLDKTIFYHQCSFGSSFERSNNFWNFLVTCNIVFFSKSFSCKNFANLWDVTSKSIDNRPRSLIIQSVCRFPFTLIFRW